MIFYLLLADNPNRISFSGSSAWFSHGQLQVSHSGTKKHIVFTTEDILFGFLPTTKRFSK